MNTRFWDSGIIDSSFSLNVNICIESSSVTLDKENIGRVYNDKVSTSVLSSMRKPRIASTFISTYLQTVQVMLLVVSCVDLTNYNTHTQPVNLCSKADKGLNEADWLQDVFQWPSRQTFILRKLFRLSPIIRHANGIKETIILKKLSDPERPNACLWLYPHNKSIYVNFKIYFQWLKYYQKALPINFENRCLLPWIHTLRLCIICKMDVTLFHVWL